MLYQGMNGSSHLFSPIRQRKVFKDPKIFKSWIAYVLMLQYYSSRYFLKKNLYWNSLTPFLLIGNIRFWWVSCAPGGNKRQWSTYHYFILRNSKRCLMQILQWNSLHQNVFSFACHHDGLSSWVFDLNRHTVLDNFSLSYLASNPIPPHSMTSSNFFTESSVFSHHDENIGFFLSAC